MIIIISITIFTNSIIIHLSVNYNNSPTLPSMPLIVDIFAQNNPRPDVAINEIVDDVLEPSVTVVPIIDLSKEDEDVIPSIAPLKKLLKDEEIPVAPIISLPQPQVLLIDVTGDFPVITLRDSIL